ncbi:S24 family peptidase [Hydrogenophaga sp. OTU3427]|uniref:S24 family peptidase n=1 Tax=Hydrogenophaga sp. OTU3427 TaxID=3043856 RepID=UPI00313BE7F7
MTKKKKDTSEQAALSPVRAILAMRLRECRRQKEPSVSQADLAKLIGRDKASVCNWESGKHEPPNAILLELAKFYGVTPSWLLGQEDAPPNPRRLSAPEFHTVPVLSEAEMVNWTVDSSAQKLVTLQRYDSGAAAAIRVESSALASQCPVGAYAVVAQRSQVNAGEVVVVAVEGAKAPLFRKVVRDGSSLLLIADDTRYPTVPLDSNVRVIGRVVETVEFRCL